MGVALFVRFEREIPGLNGWEMDGKSLAANLDVLDETVSQLGLTPLLDFYSASPEDYSDLLGEEDDPSEDDLPAAGEFGENEGDPSDEELTTSLAEGSPSEQWFLPADGLRTVRGLDVHVRQHPDAYERVDALLVDLGDLDRYISAAAEHGVRFHLSFDL